MNDTHKGNASSCQDQAAAVCGSTRRLWQWMTLRNQQPPHYFAVLLLGPAAAAVCLTAARVAHQPPTASSASRRASETVFSFHCWPVDSKNLELPWKKPRSSASPPTGEKKKEAFLCTSHLHSWIVFLCACLSVCLLCANCVVKPEPFLLYWLFLSLRVTAVDLLSEMLVCVPQLTFFQQLAPQALVRSLLLINFVLLFFVVWTSCCSSRCQSQGKGSIYSIYTPQFFLRVLLNTWRKLGRCGGW